MKNGTRLSKIFDKVVSTGLGILLAVSVLSSCAEVNPNPVGENEKSGKSAYEIAVDDGFQGTYTEWLLSLKGEKGDTGAQGEKGEKGDTGAQGEKGEKGDTGAQGEKGEKGDTGAQGEKGEKGDTGAQGEKGEKGDTGAQGEKGEKGDTGAQGEKGEKGDTGAQGEKGEKGDTGAQGEKGEKGDTGRGILKIEVIDGFLWITYTDNPDEKVNAGKISQGEDYEGTEGLEFYPLPDGTVGVKAGRALYLEEVTIPAVYQGMVVSTILDHAFENAYNLKKIALPTSITAICSYAFYGCKNAEITIGVGVNKIGANAFYGCTPDNITFEDEETWKEAMKDKSAYTYKYVCTPGGTIISETITTITTEYLVNDFTLSELITGEVSALIYKNNSYLANSDPDRYPPKYETYSLYTIEWSK